MNNRKAEAKPDPREQLTWFPRGFCSAWNERKKGCHHAGGCACLKRKTQGAGEVRNGQ